MFFWNKKLVHKRDHLLTDVLHCARCKADHELLEFRQLTNPVVDSDGTVWGWWSLCPYAGEPILLKRVEGEYGE